MFWLDMLRLPRTFPRPPAEQEKLIESLESIRDPRVIDILIEVAHGKWRPRHYATRGVLGFLDDRTLPLYVSTVRAVADALVRIADREPLLVRSKLKALGGAAQGAYVLHCEVASRTSDPGLCGAFAGYIYLMSLHSLSYWEEDDRRWTGWKWLGDRADHLSHWINRYELTQRAWKNVRKVFGGIPPTGPSSLFAAIENHGDWDLTVAEVVRLVSERDFPRSWTDADCEKFFRAGKACLRKLLMTYGSMSGHMEYENAKRKLEGVFGVCDLWDSEQA
jgi:hypothetical protein